ncbi:hypothetical protein U1Q18_008091 [Sarracenia purpurea var. burkii]
MADLKQSHLNGAYYGPSIPPPKSSHRPGRGGGCDCCGCLCGCLFNLLFKIVFSLIVTVGLAVFVFWLIFRPNAVKFRVTDASLARFDLNTTTNKLYYNLNLTVAIRNPNKHIGIYYDRIEARTYYGGQRFAAADLPSFYQGTKNTTELSLALDGQNMVVLQEKKLSAYDSDKSSGSYSVDMKLYLRVRFKLRGVKTPRFKPKIECDLKVPLDSNGKASGSFETTKCGFDW